jgi:hypothetical protein
MSTDGQRQRLRKVEEGRYGRHARMNCTHDSIRPSSPPQTVSDPAPYGDTKALKGLMSC